MGERLFTPPDTDLEDDHVLAEIERMRGELAAHLHTPKRWEGTLRRSAQAKAIQGSNSIEGYVVSDADAAAAVIDGEPLTTDEQTWREIQGYRQVMTFVLHLAGQPEFVVDEQTLRTMHFMLLSHDMAKSPGHYRTGPIYIQDERTGDNVYEGPDASRLPALMHAFAESIQPQTGMRTLVTAAMAHLNLVMIHPFRDGNGRMARAAQTLVLAQDAILEPTFSSIEEWLGHNTDDYYRVLAVTCAGAWHPERSARLWVKFNLRAHHMQAQTVQRRFAEAERLLTAIFGDTQARGLPERVIDPLHMAALGFRLTRPVYAETAVVEVRTASRDLNDLVAAGFLWAHGQTRGRHYSAGPALTALLQDLHNDRPRVVDPYPWLLSELHAPTHLAE